MGVALCGKHGKYPWYGGVVYPEKCTVCQLEEENKQLKEQVEKLTQEKIKLSPIERAGYLLAAIDPEEKLKNVAGALEEQDRLRKRLGHALAALRHIARTCIEEPDIAQFASRASDDPPSAFAPKEDYESEQST